MSTYVTARKRTPTGKLGTSTPVAFSNTLHDFTVRRSYETSAENNGSTAGLQLAIAGYKGECIVTMSPGEAAKVLLFLLHNESMADIRSLAGVAQ